jgi:putative molybdopterin biosynthesis protein
MSQLKSLGIQVRLLSVGSSAGLASVKRGQCDIASMHLFDPVSQSYNEPYLSEGLSLLKGYRRRQGLLFKKDDPRFQGTDAKTIIHQIKNDSTCMMINRNAGSGTRVLIDQLLDGEQPNGYLIQTSNHRAVMAAVQQGRADWGVAIEAVADDKDIGFLPIKDEHYDFMVSDSKLHKNSVQDFIHLLQDEQLLSSLAKLKIQTDASTGSFLS